MTTQQLSAANAALASGSPEDAIRWALQRGKRPVVTTNFRPYEVAILYAVAQQSPDIPVVWCDTGYNTAATYRHAEDLISRLRLNIQLYVPAQTAAHRDVVMGVPEIDTPEHATFTEQLKLEPFRRAMAEHRPDVWFTNLRRGQTALRDGLDVVSLGNDGVIKVSPFYRYTDVDLDAYLEERGLPNEERYYDPTKALANRECGLHT